MHLAATRSACTACTACLPAVHAHLECVWVGGLEAVLQPGSEEVEGEAARQAPHLRHAWMNKFLSPTHGSDRMPCKHGGSMPGGQQKQLQHWLCCEQQCSNSTQQRTFARKRE